MAGAWKSRPVFITSTFLDMQGERDFLRTVVFPDLEEKLKARRRHLEWIDLRVGVANASAATEEARELQVLKVCLAEVKRSRPFLIALIGDRYGWVPPEERIKAAAVEEGFAADVAGRSVTDLEIDFGVLSDPEQRKRSYFYFREPLPYAAMGDAAADYSEEFDTKDPEAAGRVDKLKALKERIEKQFPDRVRAYRAHWDGEGVAGFDQLRELVSADLWRELDAETADALDQGEIPWQEAERAAMADFAEDRARDFVGRKDVLRLIAKFAASKPGEGPWGLCVTGAAGAGKSALWGMLQARLPQAKFALVLGHAAGASQRASSVDAMLRRWIDELAADLGVPSGLAEDAKDEDVEAAFASLLGRTAQKRRVLILVDALDQFEQTTRALNLTWLPRLWPDNARLIATAIPGEASQALLQRPGVEEAPLPPLVASEARDIVAGVCRRYHREFEAQVIEAVVAKPGASGPACGNPLWLTMAVEELNLLDADDFARARRDYRDMKPAEALCALMCEIVSEMPADVPSLYAWSFDRAAALFGAPLTQAFLGMIAVSRGGWRESDFRVVLPKLSGEPWDELRFARLRRLFRSVLPKHSGERWDELRFAQLRRMFRGQMLQRGALGQWDFAHGQMRPAAKAWLARRKSRPEPAIHNVIADHLLALPADDPLHVSETILHLMLEFGAPARARNYYGSASLTDAETDGATHMLAELVLAAPTGDRTAALDQVLRLLGGGNTRNRRSSIISANVASNLLYDFNDLIDQRLDLGLKARLFDRIEIAYKNRLRLDPGHAGWQQELSLSYNRIGGVLRAQGNLPQALQYYRDGLAIRDQLARDDPGNARRLSDLSASYQDIGDVLAAQGNLPEALKTCRDGLAIRNRLVQDNPGNTDWQYNLSLSFSGVGDVLVSQNSLPEALKSFRDGLAICDRLVKADPDNAGWQRNLSVSYNKIGDVLKEQGNLPEALTSFRDSLAIAERLAKADPGNTGWQRDLSVSYNKIGDVLWEQGSLPEALKYYRDGLAIADHLAKSDHGNTGWQRDLSVSYNHVADVLRAQGNLAEALKYYRDELAIADHLAKADLGNAGWQRDLSVSYRRVGDVLVEQGKLPEALKSFRDSLAIVERLAKADTGNARWQRDLSASYCRIGDVLVEQGNLTEALKSFHDSLAITERLAKADPGNAGWQRDFYVSLWRVGDVEFSQGNLGSALNNLRTGQAIIERLAETDPSNVGWQRDLIFSYVKIAETDPSQARVMLTRAAEVANAMQSRGILAPRDARLPGEMARRIAALPR